MFRFRLREQRGKTSTENFDSFHTFSFEKYFDPFNMGFSDLRAINDNTLKPFVQLKLQEFSDMEIINIVTQGKIEHKNFTGNSVILTPGDIEAITAGTGITYCESNPCTQQNSRILQICILPNKKNLNPYYSVKNFQKEKMMNKLRLIVSQNGKSASLKIHQDAELYMCFINAQITTSFDIPPNRKLWIQVISGAIEIKSGILEAGDGISIINERGYLDITGVETESCFLLFSLRNLSL